VLFTSKHQTRGGYMVDLLLTHDDRETTHRIIMGKHHYEPYGAEVRAAAAAAAAAAAGPALPPTPPPHPTPACRTACAVRPSSRLPPQSAWSGWSRDAQLGGLAPASSTLYDLVDGKRRCCSAAQLLSCSAAAAASTCRWRR
jgi:hypothetical protein